MIHTTADIHPTAIIYPDVTIGENVKIGAYCIVGAPAERNGNHQGKGVIIQKGVILHGLNTVDAGTENPTTIGRHSQLLKGAHVGHDAFLRHNVTLSCGAKIGGHAYIDEFCNIGLNASVHQIKRVPRGVMLGMNSCITKKTELKEFSIYAGVPARYIGENKILKQRLEI